MVWMGTVGGQILSPFWFGEELANGKRYLALLQDTGMCVGA